MTGSVRATSFRDPAGSLFEFQDRIFRIVNSAGIEHLEAFLRSATAAEFIGSGRLVRTDFLSADETSSLLSDPAVGELFHAMRGHSILEHERVAFPSYPYEWAPEMLQAAGRLTLDLGQALLRDGLGLKDATPYNILFRGPEPVFVDVLSCEVRDPNDPVWLPYAQFVRTFLLPLLAERRLGIGIDQCLASRRDGPEPGEVYRWTSPFQRLRPPFLGLVSIPTWLASRCDIDDDGIYRKRMAGREKATFILESLFNRLRRSLDRVRPVAGRPSPWSGYMSRNSYSDEEFQTKETLVREFLNQCRPKAVLDVGCNTGYFSVLAARLGAAVVAIDYDPVVVGATWRRARLENLNILPLVVDLTRPTPGVGWLNRESRSFLDRAYGSFDTVMMLAAIHHMLVTERVPLDEIVKLAAALTDRWFIVEFVAPEDPMFRRLVRGREALHSSLNRDVFEQACRQRFDVVRAQPIGKSARCLYLLRKRS